MTRLLTAAFLCGLLTTTTLAGDWLGFRGPGGQGLSTEDNLPSSWSESENLSWKAVLPGPGASSPITLGKHIYLTCYSGFGHGTDGSDVQGLRLHLVCLNRADGSQAWSKEIMPKQPESGRVRDHGYAGPTPVTDGESLFVFFGKSGVFKFTLAGEQIWNADVGSGTHGWGCGTSPVLYKDLVIVNASVESGSLYAINKADGSVAWKAGGMQASWNTPHMVTVGDKQEVVVSVKGKLLAFDPANGDSLWTCRGIQDYVCPSIVSQDGVVYAIGGRTSRCFAVKAGGRGNVSETHLLWEAKAGSNVSSPAIHDGHLYWVSDRNKVAYCVELKTGDIKYSERFKGQPYASTVIGDGKVYIVTRFSGTFVLAAKPEFELLSQNKFDDDSRFNASPVISGKQLLIRSDRFLYCIAAAE